MVEQSTEFSRSFREEHRRIRDALLALREAFEARDIEHAREHLCQTLALAGPHFRYEEEVLYPALTPIFGPDYVDKLLVDHDRAIDAARRLHALATKDVLGDGDVREGVRLVRETLPHVSDCEGLSLMVEILPRDDVAAILGARNRARAEGLDLLEWANSLRPEVAPGMDA